jgi:MFS family permease
MPRGILWLIAAQFFSALADNALLIVAIAQMAQIGSPLWWTPLLKFCFTLSYVLFAPWIGVLADAGAKSRLMMWMNALKMLGALVLLCPLHPLLGFAIAGLGAAAYAPAKYGLVTEMVAPEKLVTANAWIEVSVVCAVLLGTVMGGFLVSDWFTGSAGALAVRGVLAGIAPHSGALGLSLLGVLALYVIAALLNLKIPDSGRRYGARWQSPRVMLAAFAADNRRVWCDHEGGLSLAVTTLFWGVGATLQFVVLRWAQLSLNLPLDQAAYLQGVVAVGVVGGAALAGWVVGIEQARRVLPLGIAMGLVVPWMSAVHSLEMAVVLLALVGALGGLFVVPMNALLQHRGAILLTAGRSIAVQGFNENLSVLLVLGLYTSLVAADLPMNTLLLGLGLGVAACIAALMWKKRGPVPTLAR